MQPRNTGQKSWVNRVFLFTALSMVAAGPIGRAKADERQPSAEAIVRLDLSVLDTAGVTHSLRPEPGRESLAFVFLQTECPISNGYVPELNRQWIALRDSHARLRLYGVISDPGTTRAAAAAHVAKFKYEFPVLFDSSGLLAQALKPTHAPEAFVVDGERKVAYRGRIDDLYADIGKKRTSATRHDLTDAVTAVLAGQAPATPRTEPVGCLFESAPSPATEGKVTFARDIAPIVFANCAKCHRDGEVAPFPLMTYADAAKRARQIVRVTASRFMPPWKPQPDFGHFVDERRLTDRELELLRVWAESGAPQGNDSDLPPPPQFAEGWQVGEPDLVVGMSEPFEIPADGRDVFRNFVIPSGVAEDKLVAAVEFRPGNRRAVHHAIFYLDTSGIARKKDADDPGPGYGSFGGPGFVPSGAIGGWAPGGTPQVLRDGMGRPLRKGSDIVIQIHYHPTGKPEIDQSSIGIHFVKGTEKTKAAAAIMVIDRRLYIPPGEADYRMAGSYTLPHDVTFVGITPHMHLLGREMKAVATLPDGAVQPLICVKDWNFNWQDQYQFAQPIRLPKGTRLDVTARYDNSDQNPLNPNTPPKTVTWGEQTPDEMFICFFLVSTDEPRQLFPLILDNVRAMGPALQKKRDKPAAPAGD
ncbi:MAG: redoxin domain-containing protein [Planctomycetia bacterium]|nr:redoxin domain-containing protein [Planctomycetia bacterium]